MIEMLKKARQKAIRFCVRNVCFILPYPDSGVRARFLKNSALFLYVLVLLSFQFYVYRLSPRILGFATDININDLYSLTNQERVAAGLSKLSRNSKLEKAALSKAKDMFAKDYWAHYAPDGSTTPWQFITQFGYAYKLAGENLAKDFDTSAAVVAAWIASPSHRANILGTDYKDIGMVVVNGAILGEETTLVVQMFGTPLASTTAAAPSQGGTASEPSGGAAGAETEPEPEPEPVTVVGPTEEKRAAVSQPEELTAVGITPVQMVAQVFNPVSSPKTIPLGFGFFLLGLFTLDEVVMLRDGLTRDELKRTGENIAHMVILGVLMVVVCLARTGGII